MLRSCNCLEDEWPANDSEKKESNAKSAQTSTTPIKLALTGAAFDFYGRTTGACVWHRQGLLCCYLVRNKKASEYV
eukprot:1783839-Pyramimonas_sp.AAC.1